MSHDRYYDIVIVGAGASGLMSACLLACSGKSVLILEKEPKPGRKLLATGNGRCNLTNLDMSWRKYYGDREWVSTVIESVPPRRVIRTFENLGVMTREQDGYVYPHTNQASTVLNMLLRGCQTPQITLETEQRVTDIHVRGNGETPEEDIIDVDPEDGVILSAPARFTVDTETASYGCEYLILATGGPAGKEQGGCDDGYALLRRLGHTVTPVYPGLTGLHAAGRWWKEVAGSRVRGSFTLFTDGTRNETHTGEIQITKTGVSGIPVFQVCRLAAESLEKNEKVAGSIDFVPTMTEEECERWITRFGLDGLVPVKWIPVLKREGKDSGTLARIIRDFSFTITDTYGIDRAQVSAGGVPTSEVSPLSFESQVCEGLYVMGELNNADGICGGYNLHLAWSSAILATESILDENTTE